MTKDEFFTLVEKADSGNLDAMKRAAFVMVELAEKNTPGNLELAMFCLKKSDEYHKKVKAIDPTW